MTENSSMTHLELLPSAKRVLVSKPGRITTLDLVRLWPGVYLNDNLVNFYLQHIRNTKLPPKTHIFSSYFYTKLCADGNEKVQSWTKDVRLDSFDSIFVPIFRQEHWSIAVICQMMGRPVCILHLDSGKSFRLHHSIHIFNRLRNWLDHERKQQLQGNNNKINGNNGTAVGSIKSTNKRTRKGRKQLQQRQQQYAGSYIPGFSPVVPQQPNETDCGVYMLEMIDRLVGSPVQITETFLASKARLESPFSKTWFDARDCLRKRTEIRTLISEAAQAETEVTVPEAKVKSVATKAATKAAKRRNRRKRTKTQL